jgi:hypothetical protein
MKEITSPAKLLKVVIELVENVAKTGRYSPEAMLQDDGFYATSMAEEYVRACASFRPTVVVVRECQHIDPESLRFFLTIGEEAVHTAVIFEYTTDDGEFSPDHQKLVLETLPHKERLVIFDLLRLSPKEFRFLLGKYAPLGKTLESAVELKWDGNLRLIKELKYRLMVGHSVGAAAVPLLDATMHQNLAGLTKQARLLLALIAVHVEAIGQDALTAVFRRVDRTACGRDVVAALDSLVGQEKYVTISGAHVAIADEDILDAVLTSPLMMPMIRLAETSLREFYLDQLRGTMFASVPLLSTLRQAIALCGRTGDIVALRGLLKTLDSAMCQAFDQTLYGNIVADAVLSHKDLSEIERLDLVDWVSAAAYEVGDYPTATSLLETLPDPRAYDLAMMGCCYGEINRHQDAIMLAQRLLLAQGDSDGTLIARLIECASLFALGQFEAAEAVHAALRDDTALAASPLFGFVLRYTEIIKDFPECTADVLLSAEHLAKNGMMKASAYSLLAGAMHVAYTGQIDAARRLVAQAETQLSAHIRDRQILLNNAVVIELLSPDPDVPASVKQLDTALFSARDDFSRLVIEINRLICNWLLNDLVRARHCASVIDEILEEPRFGNRDIVWTACFNAWSFFLETGDHERADHFKALAFKVGLDRRCYRDYWMRRFGLAQTAPPAFEFLLTLKYHPEYLSHWLIDVEGLARLKEARAQ